MTDKTRAIMPVHYSGAVGNLNEIYDFAIKNNLRVIEDAAHAFGTVYENKVVGGFGDIACFSFDGIKNITSGEGGCVVTADLAILAKVKDARLLGVQNDSEKRYSGTRSWEFDVSEQGWRYHMSDIMAAIGIEQLSRFSDFSSKRRNLAKRYVENLKHHVKIGLFQYDYETVNPHIFPIRVESDKREKLRTLMLENNIQTGIHYFPNHQLSLFASSTKSDSLPVTTEIYPEIMTLPLHPDLTFDDIDFVSNRLMALIDAEDLNNSFLAQI
jgi:dTDP-4-amino-4,6-dideoxygalactose transaminase